MPLTKADVQALDGQALADAVLAQVLGWTRADRVAIDQGTAIDDAWLETSGAIVNVRPRSSLVDLMLNDWAVRVMTRMAALGKRMILQAAQGGGYLCAFTLPGATALEVTAAAVVSPSVVGAVIRAALFAVQV
jgi:hypothetical protein